MILLLKDKINKKFGNTVKFTEIWNEKFPDNKITTTCVYLWQSNKSQPSYINMERICYLLECELKDIWIIQKVQFRSERKRVEN